MASDDEDDYMSDKYLKTEKKSSQPGLVNRTKKREHKMEAKKRKLDEAIRNRSKSIKLIEKEQLKEGLQKAITSDNKGFAMLARMGYKQGESIGRSSSNGIIEPIGITVKVDRFGLGRDTAVKEIKQKQYDKLKESLHGSTNVEEISVDDFRKRNALKCDQKILERDLL